MKTIELNLNDMVWVKLTPIGVSIVQKHDAKLEKFAPSMKFDSLQWKPKDANGWTQWQLHELMHMFGEHCYAGCSLPFETAIELELKPEPKAPLFHRFLSSITVSVFLLFVVPTMILFLFEKEWLSTGYWILAMAVMYWKVWKK